MKLKLILFFALIVFQLPAFAERILVFGGKTGWIGQKLVNYLEEMGHEVKAADSRLENRSDILNEIEAFAPTHVINSAGVIGTPNVDWCESHQVETIRSNILGALNLADITFQKGLHLTQFGTGCVYEYDKAHPMGGGIGFTEDDKPNFDGSYYSKTKAFLDSMIRAYPNVLNLRVRMPISHDLHPKSLITKLTRYQKIINIPNSMTILEDMLPIAIDMTLRGYKGVFNFTNPGTLSHNEILDLYKEYIDPDFTYTNFTVEEQNQVLKAQRSNNQLDMSKLQELYPEVPTAKEGIRRAFQNMAKNRNKKA